MEVEAEPFYPPVVIQNAAGSFVTETWKAWRFPAVGLQWRIMSWLPSFRPNLNTRTKHFRLNKEIAKFEAWKLFIARNGKKEDLIY